MGVGKRGGVTRTREGGVDREGNEGGKCPGNGGYACYYSEEESDEAGGR